MNEKELEITRLANELAAAQARIEQEIAERVNTKAELRKYQEHFKEIVEERTADLRASEARYRTMFDGIPVGLYRTTPAGQILDANLALVEMYGYPSRELLLATNIASTYIDPGERQRWKALMEAEGVVRDFEAQIRKLDGSVIWVSDTARAVKDENGQVQYYEGNIEDISERKQAEDELRKYQEHLEELVEERTGELRESEERYRTLFDGIPVGLYRTTPDGKILETNMAMVQMAGYPRKDMVQDMLKATDIYVDPQERSRWQALMEQEGVVRDFEAQFRRFDGEIIWLSDTARAVKDEHGQVLYYEGRLEDITERKRIERELRHQKDYFESLFVNSPIAIMTADLEAKVVSWNPMAEKLFGYTQQEAIGVLIDDLVATQPAVRDEAQAYTQRLFSTDRLQATTKRTRKDGSLVDVEVLVLPAIVAGEKVGYIGIYYDISELLQARRDAESANKAKSIFLANMSHELRTPLNAILGFTQLMDGDPNLTPDQQENLEIINQSGEHLLSLINDVLEMSKIEAGRVEIREITFDLHHLLGSLDEMFRLKATDKGLDLIFRLEKDIPRYVISDEGKLRQVLSNLLGNAIKFTQHGHVSLTVSALPGEAERISLKFEVQDSGPGIAPEDYETVFDPFVQAGRAQDYVHMQSPEGTGLGLSISRQFVQLMGGDIDVRSEVGVGSTFTFRITASIAEAGESSVSEPRPNIVRLAPDQPVYRILVVEDKETNRRLLVKLMEQLGFQVQEAANGQEAVDAFQHWDPHLIWMDMRMPLMNGLEATRRIKAMPGGDGVVIIALTATAFEEDREQILQGGCDNFIRKPFRKDEIYDALVKYLGVQFISKETPLKTFVSEKTDIPATFNILQAMAAMPPDWLEEVRQATKRADLYQILDLINLKCTQHPMLSEVLTRMVEKYEYQRLLYLIEESQGQ